MARAPFQVLVFPFHFREEIVKYGLFKRSDELYWQGIAGGGEAEESPEEAAIRETMEEASIVRGQLIRLQSMCMIPVVNISGFRWGPMVLVVPEHSFGYKMGSEEVQLSYEHSEFGWFSFEEAHNMVKWESNKTALWELNHRVQNNLLEY